MTDDGPALGLALPRLIAPLSMSTVTQQKPTLRWVLGSERGRPVVELCKDRSCTAPLRVATQVASDHLSAVPAAALPAGWVFWRVRLVDGTRSVSSATWQFWVGRSSASNPVDTGYGATLDVNGDGYPDFLVSTPGGGGTVHLYLGSATPSETGWNGVSATERIDLTNPGSTRDNFGFSVASAGDVNGDGFADFLIGAFNAGASNGGAAYLYLGSATPSAGDWNGNSPSKRIGLASPHATATFFGVSAASAGDVNGDGFADFLVATSGAAMAHIYLGAAMPDGAIWNAASPESRIDLISPDDASNGSSGTVTGVGDVNGDGFADFLIGADLAIPGGAAHLYLGAATPGGATWNGASPAGRIDLVSPDGGTDNFGNSVAGVGDVNDDGYTDFLVGGYAAKSFAGAAHLYLGAATPGGATWNGASPAGRIDLISPDGANASFGIVASAGDVNGDGFADFLVGAPGAEAAHLYFGAATPGGTSWNGASPVGRIELTSPDGARAFFGSSVAGLGDVNGDGYTDFLVGAPGADSITGIVHLYLGAQRIARNSGSLGRRIDVTNPGGPGTEFGFSLACAGDVIERRDRRASRPAAPFAAITVAPASRPLMALAARRGARYAAGHHPCARCSPQLGKRSE